MAFLAHARDRLDKRRLELGELLDRDPVHVDDGRVDRADSGLDDGLLGVVFAFDRRDGILRGGDAAEGVRPLLRCLTLQEDRRVAWVRDGLDDVLAGGEESGVGGSGVESQHDRARTQLGDEVCRDLSEGEVGNGEHDDVCIGDRGGGVGKLAARLDRALLAGGGVLDVPDGVPRLHQVVGHSHAHLSTGADDGDLVGAAHCVLLRCSRVARVHSRSVRMVVVASSCQGSQCSTISLMSRSRGFTVASRWS